MKNKIMTRQMKIGEDVMYSPLTEHIYFVNPKEKVDITDNVLYCARRLWLGIPKQFTSNGKTYEIIVKEII